jgi:hypothetical protein
MDFQIIEGIAPLPVLSPQLVGIAVSGLKAGPSWAEMEVPSSMAFTEGDSISHRWEMENGRGATGIPHTSRSRLQKNCRHRKAPNKADPKRRKKAPAS